MNVQCIKCEKKYDDTYRWTFCPHDTFQMNTVAMRSDGEVKVCHTVGELNEWMESPFSIPTDDGTATIPTANLVIMLQKLARNVSHFTPGFRAAFLKEAAKRLNDYRQKERRT